MPVPLELTVARQEQLGSVAERTANRALIVWRRGMTADFDRSWATVGAQVADMAAAGQAQATVGASRYMAQLAVADHVTAPSGGTVEPDAWTGVDASGRTLDGLLYGAVTAAKTTVGAGAGIQGALFAGATYLAVMTHTAVMDAGRSADLTAMTARTYTHYIRVVSAGACSRCAILAGISSAKEPFRRHPAAGAPHTP